VRKFKLIVEDEGVVLDKKILDINQLETYIKTNITKNVRGLNEIFEDIDQMSVGNVKSFTPDSEFDKKMGSVEGIVRKSSSIQEMFSMIRALEETGKKVLVKRIQ
jgi:hypothetical protein